ncbi:hypothetical protein EES39_27880 [Streptomyces sp. ADI92-24]|nr:hypothetical protein EES39_27880 [Streptomyces sp. ADI92-24]
MARQHETVALWRGTQQGEPHQRRSGQVETAGAVGGEEVREAFLSRAGALRSGQVQFLQRHGNLGGDSLYSLVQILVEEPDSQVGVPAQQAADGGAQGGNRDGAFEFEDELCGVDVDGVGVVQGVEVHAGLKRRQRQYVFELEPGHLRPPHLFCSRSICAWLSETRGRSDGV